MICKFFEMLGMQKLHKIPGPSCRRVELLIPIYMRLWPMQAISPSINSCWCCWLHLILIYSSFIHAWHSFSRQLMSLTQEMEISPSTPHLLCSLMGFHSHWINFDKLYIIKKICSLRSLEIFSWKMFSSEMFSSLPGSHAMTTAYLKLQEND